MNYLLDKKNKRNKILYRALFVILLVTFFYFRASIFQGLSSVGQTIFRPVLTFGNSFVGKFNGAGSFFSTKKSLTLENEDLQRKLDEMASQLSNYNKVVEENLQMKEILGRKREGIPMILSAILSGPGESLYDTLLIDVGADQNIEVGDLVYAFGSTPIGRVALVYGDSAKVLLFSSPGEKTEAIISLSNSLSEPAPRNAFMELVGRGGGNFEMTLLRDFSLPIGSEVVLPGLTSHTVAVVKTIISDPRDAFKKALLSSPVNVRELKFVEVEK